MYPPEIFVQQFDKVADGFQRALDELKTVSASAAGVTSAQRRALAEECGVAEAAAIHFRSSANQARFVMARRARAAAKNAGGGRAARRHLGTVLEGRNYAGPAVAPDSIGRFAHRL